jgi:arsenate reductase
MSAQIWHNPRCSKSRAAKSALDDAGVVYAERRYLDDPPSAEELDRVLTMLGLEPWQLARLKEPVAVELGLRELEHDRDRWITLMIEHPVLIERPIIVTAEGKAVVARDPDAVRTALEGA